MASTKTTVVSISILIILLLATLLILTYNSKCKANSYEHMQDMNNMEGFKSQSAADISNQSIDFNKINGGLGTFNASEEYGNEVYSNLESLGPNASNGVAQGQPLPDPSFTQQPYPSGNEQSQENDSQSDIQACFPRDRLTADDLLPKDAADSKWARLNPSGTGDIHDQNYLTAGYHIGVNTIGQSLRNANLQLRSEIPNPQAPVGPWMISTIEPDLRQNTLEIGSS